MQYFSDVVQDRNGNVVSSASVLVKNYPALTTATIYDSTGASIANPITTSSDGEYTVLLCGSGNTGWAGK